MKVKYNESTELRPKGGRLMDDVLVSMDVPNFIKQIKSESAWEKNDRNAITIYKTNGMRIVLIALHEDAVITRHIAIGVISVQVLDGEINFITDHQSIILKTGQMVALHEREQHSVAAIKESIFLLTLAESSGS